jgi:hypothetical protein
MLPVVSGVNAQDAPGGCHAAGVNVTYLSGIENGKRNPGSLIIGKLCVRSKCRSPSCSQACRSGHPQTPGLRFAQALSMPEGRQAVGAQRRALTAMSAPPRLTDLTA